MKIDLLKIKNKKGFTYIIVTTVVVAVLLSIFFASNRYKYQDQEALQQVRIRAMNDFIKNLNSDIHRATYISASRSLLALEADIALNPRYLSNMSESFKETFFYGTINNTGSVTMANSTFSDYLAKVQYLAKSIGITLDINVTDIRLMQSEPWAIDVYVLMNITATDNRNTSSWNIYNEYVTSIPILNLRDPVYIVSTQNKVPNTIKKLNATLLVNGSDTSALQEHINASYYIASNYSPNYIMRFEGRFDADDNGIESVVNVIDLATQGRPRYDDRIKVDYIYFNDLSYNKVCNVTDIPEELYFVIPENRKGLYQIENLTYSDSTCP